MIRVLKFRAIRVITSILISCGISLRLRRLASPGRHIQWLSVFYQVVFGPVLDRRVPLIFGPLLAFSMVVRHWLRIVLVSLCQWVDAVFQSVSAYFIRKDEVSKFPLTSGKTRTTAASPSWQCFRVFLAFRFCCRCVGEA